MHLAAPESIRRNARPPIPMDAAPHSGAAGSIDPGLRPTVRSRPFVAPQLIGDPITELGYSPADPYVRRFWTAVIGPGAVADLLRLAAAARCGTRIRRPTHLHILVGEGLVFVLAGRLLVRPTIPPLGPQHTRRLPPRLQREHCRLRLARPHRA